MLAPQNADDALLLILHAETYYRNLFRAADEDDAYYEGRIENLIETPEGTPIVIPTTGRAVIDEAVASVIPDRIRVTYPVRTNTKAGIENSENVGTFLAGMWDYWRQISDVDPLSDFAKGLNLSGKACWKIHIDYTLWPQLTEEMEKALREEDSTGKAVVKMAKKIQELRDGNFPIVCRPLPIGCVMEDPTVGSRKMWLIEKYEMGGDEVQNQYADYINEFQDIGPATIKYQVHEVWTASRITPRGEWQQGKHWVFVNRELRVEEDNTFDRLPYVVKYVGLGRETYAGQPELKAVGILTRQVKSMLLAEARRNLHFEAMFSQMAFPIAFFPDTVSPESISLAPGSVNFVGKTVFDNLDKMWVNAPLPAPEYMDALNYIAAQIERGTVQRSLRGAYTPGTHSAAQQGQLFQAAQLRVKPVEQALVSAVVEANEIVLYMIDRVLQSVLSLWTAEEKSGKRTVGPKNIKGHYVNYVEFMPSEDSEKERKLVLAMNAKTQGGFSDWDALMYAGFDNASDIIARRRADELMQEPLVKRAMAKEFLNDAFGVDISELELSEQMDQAQEQVTLRDFANYLMSGSMRGVGDPMSADGNPNPNPQQAIQAGQQPGPAMAQFGPPQLATPSGNPSALQQGDPLAGLVQNIKGLQ